MLIAYLLASIFTVQLIRSVDSAVPISARNVLFGHAIKNGPLAAYPAEQTTFQHNCTNAPCVVTSINIPSIYPTGGNLFDWENGRLCVYIDGESSPSINVTILELAHVGALAAISSDTPVDGSPFGNDLFGKTAKTGGVYTTMRIPFASSIRTTITAPPSATAAAVFWFVIRGIEALPITLGSELILPDQARLTMQRVNRVNIQPRDIVTLASVPNGTAGALVTVMMDAQSMDLTFLEGCMRFFANGAAAPQFLSSGTEDFFYSASYFDEGIFATSQAGLTYANKANATSMWKRLDARDFIPWNNGMELQWRNNEDGNCPNTWPWPTLDAGASPSVATKAGLPGSGLKDGPADAKTIVWMYTWPTQPA